MLSDRLSLSKSSLGTSLILPWQIDSVVSIKGSFRTMPNFAEGEELVQDVLVGLLDKGTEKRSKIEVSTILEDCGASVQFSSAGDYVRFEAKCLKQDLFTVLELINEQLCIPAYSQEEFDLLRNRFLAQIQRQKFDTGTQASEALSRKLFLPEHPSFALPVEQLEDLIGQTTILEVKEFGGKTIGLSDFVVVLVGDVAQVKPEDVLHTLTNGLPQRQVVERTFDRLKRVAPFSNHHIEIADRNNLDVRLGHDIGLFRRSPDYLPLFAAAFMLGGNFSSRLMSTIRDRDGLTYGIRSGLSEIGKNYPGSWITSVTLSRENVERGIRSVKNEIESFVGEPTRADALSVCKDTLSGSYAVRLSTTSGVASTLLANHEFDYPPNRIDTHPDEIAALTENDVDRAKGAHLEPGQLHVVSAGTLQE